MTVDTLISIEPFRWASVGAALLCGSIIGFERQLKGKPVGVRTSSLIILGTYFFITAALLIMTDKSDPSRIVGQIVTGVGFLGAGVMLSKEGVVIGATSAATIWALAAIGVCLSTIGPLVAIKLSLLVLLVLFVMDVLEDTFSAFTRGVHRKINVWRKGG